MRLCRFDRDRLGLVDGDVVRDVTAALDVLPQVKYPLPRHDLLVAHLPDVVERAHALARTAPVARLADVCLLSPVANPGKLVAAPVNYESHVDEVRNNPALHHNNPALTVTIHSVGVFLKATSSLVGAGEGIAIRKPDRRTDPEVELAFVIGRRASHVSRADAMDYVAGYTIGLDVTIRGSEERSLRKSADSYSVLGPWLVTADEIADPGALDLELAINGVRRQKSNTRHMLLGVAELIELASSFYTLEPGDVVFTGTPDGVSQIVPGDRLVATIERIGSMDVLARADGLPSAAAGR
jgi:2-keto-4-pentenoate hydratase/2-oxohepta-3-ene-1,7-dioic acid hydratase in catechol pathway